MIKSDSNFKIAKKKSIYNDGLRWIKRINPKPGRGGGGTRPNNA